jgi:DNA-binding sugar fermentation-stimulating protein
MWGFRLVASRGVVVVTLRLRVGRVVGVGGGDGLEVDLGGLGVRRCRVPLGLCRECMVSRGDRVYVSFSGLPRVSCRVSASESNGVLVVHDARLVERLFAEAYESILGVESCSLARQAWLNGVRVDFLASCPDRVVLVEVKSTRRLSGGAARYSVAGDGRGLRQLEALAVAAKAAGAHLSLVVAAARTDAGSVVVELTGRVRALASQLGGRFSVRAFTVDASVSGGDGYALLSLEARPATLYTL